MKVFTLFMSLLSVSVFANGLRCRLENSDYEVFVSVDQTKAMLTLGGDEIEHGSLNCVTVKSKPGDVPSVRVTILRCFTPSVADAGYVVVIDRSGNPKKLSAKVFHARPWGHEKVADLSCM